MPVVDADTHVDETEATWASLQGQGLLYFPTTVHQPSDGPRVNDPRSRFWLVDRQFIPRAIRDDSHHPARAARELADVHLRLRDMDRLGVDVQVIFPTFFIRYGNTDDPKAEAALCAAYNRWVAAGCAPANGRLRWAAVLPWLDPERSIEELRWAKENGACGVFRRGFELDKKMSNPYFFPVYEEASRLDLPICVHTGHPLPEHEWDRGFPIISAFTDIVIERLPDRFPELRFGFIEAGASWVPYALSQLAMQLRSNGLHERKSAFDLGRDLFTTNRLFVAIDSVDDIEYLLTLGTEDNLMAGTDYCHSDVSANTNALSEVRAWANQGRISDVVAGKILETTPQRFYGLPT